MPALPSRPQRGLVHQFAHAANGQLQPHEHRFADQVMADVQFRELRDGGNRLHVVISQPMPGVRFDPVAQQ